MSPAVLYDRQVTYTILLLVHVIDYVDPHFDVCDRVTHIGLILHFSFVIETMSDD